MAKKYPSVIHIAGHVRGIPDTPLTIKVPHQVNEMTATVKMLQLYFNLSQKDVDYTRYVLTNIHDNNIVRMVDFRELEALAPSIVSHLSTSRLSSNSEYRTRIMSGHMTWVEFANDLYNAANNLAAILQRRLA